MNAPNDKDHVPTGSVPIGFELGLPWQSSHGSLHEELQRECGPMHVLHGVATREIARRQDCDDVLFELFGENAPAQFAVVHLTWGPHPDPHPEFPSTRLYASFDSWVTECMMPDVEDWGEEPAV